MRIASAGERFGTVLGSRQAGSFFLRESEYAPGLRMPVHDHPSPYFSFVVRGVFREHCSQRDHAYEAGSLHFHGAGDPHWGSTGTGGVTCLSLIPSGSIARRLEAAPLGVQMPLPALAATAARAAREFHASDAASDLALESLCLEIAAGHLHARGVRATACPPAWLAVAGEYLRAHLDRRVTVDELAAVAGVHPAHLARGFRRHLGSSPGSYLRRLRIERARRALVDSNEAIVDIALGAGFASQAHFTHAFHRLVGLPPSAYRRRHGRRAPRSESANALVS